MISPETRFTSARTSRRTGGFALLAIGLLVGCMFEPFDGQRVVSHQPVAFKGYAVQASSLVAIEAELPENRPCDDVDHNPVPDEDGVGSTSSPLCVQTYAFQPIAWAWSTAEGGMLFQEDNTNFYYWETSAVVPPQAFRWVRASNGEWVWGARVRARQGDGTIVFTSVRQDWTDCYTAHQRTSGDFRDHCSANAENVAVLVAQ